MQPEIQIKRVEDCLEWLETNAEKYETKQSVDSLISDLGVLVKSMAFINGQMATAKRIWNKKKTESYHAWMFSSKAQGIELSPMLVKDYIASRCETDEYNYTICERCSRTITHTIDAVRTMISALKTEMQLTNETSRSGVSNSYDKEGYFN